MHDNQALEFFPRFHFDNSAAQAAASPLIFHFQSIQVFGLFGTLNRKVREHLCTDFFFSFRPPL
jgi:hypothetical protein